MKVLSKQQILKLHEMLIAQSGGSPEIRDDGLLDSALNTPFQSFSNTELYPSLLEKAARLGYGLIKNHPFVDGNKRIGTHAMKHQVNGQITVNGQIYKFQNGIGYIEGDRGYSFPERYIWTQCCFNDGSLERVHIKTASKIIASIMTARKEESSLS